VSKRERRDCASFARDFVCSLLDFALPDTPTGHALTDPRLPAFDRQAKINFSSSTAPASG
jgi:hypothetical protein